MQDEIRISLMATRQVMEDMLADSVLQQQLVKAVDCCVNALKSGRDGGPLFGGAKASAIDRIDHGYFCGDGHRQRLRL